MNYNAALYGFGALLLGAVGLCFHEFALQWQAVPAGIPARTLLAHVSGVLLIIGGGAILSRRYERAGALLLTAFFGFWVVAFHLPNAFASVSKIGAWNAPAEITFLTMGGLALFATGAGSLRASLNLVARLLAGASAMVFGFAHFNYIDFTAGFIPAWIPWKVFWAWATGAGHLAAGLAFVSGIQARLAATLLAGMMGSFVVLLHIPRVIAHPEAHAEWIMLAVSSALTGSAWLLRKYVF
ncbi:MAG TPA: DoxX family membrane protein [Steroidobacteraceae bacterium]|nr:DoxX family membrane protein [Steroidobacteraceae bacterium]